MQAPLVKVSVRLHFSFSSDPWPLCQVVPEGALSLGGPAKRKPMGKQFGLCSHLDSCVQPSRAGRLQGHSPPACGAAGLVTGHPAAA